MSVSAKPWEAVPVSKRELDRLRERRESAAPTLEYDLGDGVRAGARKLDALRRESRAVFVEERLREADGRAETSFASAKTRGRAKHDFEKSR